MQRANRFPLGVQARNGARLSLEHCQGFQRSVRQYILTGGVRVRKLTTGKILALVAGDALFQKARKYSDKLKAHIERGRAVNRIITAPI